MTINEITFEELFNERLPMELKEMIFKHAVTNNENDIEICLPHSNSKSLEAPTMDFLKRLRRDYSNKLYIEVMHYLTGPPFRWVFVSDRQPHRYLFSIFRSKVPREIREQIRHIYIRHVGVGTVIDPAIRPARPLTWKHMPLPWLPDYSPYLHLINQRKPLNDEKVYLMIRKDIRASMLLVPCIFPAVIKVDIEFHIYDLICPHGSDWLLPELASVVPNLGAPRSMGVGVPFVVACLSLAHMREVSKLDIRVFWGNYFEQGRKRLGAVGKEIEKGAQDLLSKHSIMAFQQSSSLVIPRTEVLRSSPDLGREMSNLLLAPYDGIKDDQGCISDDWCTDHTSGSPLFFTALEAICC